MHDNLPRKSRGWEHLVWIGGVSGKCHRLAHLPLSTRDRSIDKRRGGVSGGDQYAGYVKRPLIVRHFELHVVNVRLRVGKGGLSCQGIAEESIAVQVP